MTHHNAQIYNIKVRDKKNNYIVYTLRKKSKKFYYIDNALNGFDSFLKENNLNRVEFYKLIK